jgi:hypothetical protein
VEFALETGQAEERVFCCRTSDISLRGVRLLIDHILPGNSVVQVTVKAEKSSRAFAHIGRVAWCRPAEPGFYNAGIEFTTPPGPVMDEWRTALFESLE